MHIKSEVSLDEFVQNSLKYSKDGTIRIIQASRWEDTEKKMLKISFSLKLSL